MEERRRGNTLVLWQGKTDGQTDGWTDRGRGVRGHRGGPVVSTFVICHFFVFSGTFFGTFSLYLALVSLKESVSRLIFPLI